jgi:hypothetical protein
VFAPWALWVGVALVVLPLVPAFTAARPEAFFRIVGTLQQVSGTALGFVGIASARRLFGLPSFKSNLASWWAARPGRNVTIALAGASAVGLSGGFAQLEIWANMNGDTLDTRLAAAIKNIEQLRTTATEDRQRHTTAIERVAVELREFKASAGGAVEHVQRQLKEAQVGGLSIAFVALTVVIVGTLVAGFAPELGGARDSAIHESK